MATQEDKVEIFFSDLSKRVQQALLKHYQVKKPEDVQWDKYPVITIMRESSQVTYIEHYP